MDMGMNDTPSSERLHIGIFGRRNAGKSSIINAITGQNLAVVSDVKGTTTDPVLKSMELLPLGPVVLIDTPGLDDEGALGELRMKKSYQVLNKTDLALLVIDGTVGTNETEDNLIEYFIKKGVPYVLVINKADLLTMEQIRSLQSQERFLENTIFVSATGHNNINELKELIAAKVDTTGNKKMIVGDLIAPKDVVVLVVPVDSAAPKGRLILPQQQTIRDIIDAEGIVMVTKEDSLQETLDFLKQRPKMVITDSQIFKKVAKQVPKEIALTSFSILFARYKGNLQQMVQGAAYLKKLKDSDKILIAEGCTHHRQCEDIGTVKMPNWITAFTQKELQFEFTSGTEFPMELQEYAMIVHCGGCMLNEREMQYRIACAKDAAVPITNYGTCIAYMNGILERTLEVFPDVASLV